MKPLYILVRTGLVNQLKLNELKNKKDKKIRFNTIMLLVTFMLLGILIVGYAALTAFGLIQIGLYRVIPLVAITVVSLMTMFFTILKTNGILFGYKDYEMLTALPIKTTTLVASRFMQLCIINTIFSLIIMLPMGIVYGVSKNEGIVCQQPIIFYLIWFVSSLFTPLIPTTLASIIGFLIMKISAKMKHSNAISAIITFVFVIVMLAGSMFFGSSTNNIKLSDIASMASYFESSLVQIYPVGWIFGQAVLKNSLLMFVVFIAGSYIWYRLFVILVAFNYKRIQSDLASYKTNKVKTDTINIDVKSPKGALVVKEWKRFLSSNTYLLNMGMGVVMLIGMTVAVLFVSNEKLSEVLATGGVFVDIKEVGKAIMPFVIGGIAGMSATACCALSLEGSSIELLKSLPVSAKDVYLSKIIMNLMLISPPTLIASLLMCIRFAKSAGDVFVMLLLPLVFNMFTAITGMYVNIKMPNFTWENETTVVKQSFASFLGLFTTMLICFIGGVVTILTPPNLQNVVKFIIGVIVLLLVIFVFERIKKSPIPEKN